MPFGTHKKNQMLDRKHVTWQTANERVMLNPLLWR